MSLPTGDGVSVQSTLHWRGRWAAAGASPCTACCCWLRDFRDVLHTSTGSCNSVTPGHPLARS
eukprot:5328722-Prorocentrum_lima.AAC.1